VAEAPDERGEIVLVHEDADGFYWGERSVEKTAIAGARLMLNRIGVDEAVRPGVRLVRAQPAERDESRERWDVQVHLAAGGVVEIPCGSLREGVSREAAAAVFAALRRTIEERGEA
jgi:hypothetical protein